MSVQKVKTVRRTKSNMQQLNIRLSQIQLIKDLDSCHDDRDSPQTEVIEGLLGNVVSMAA